LKIKNKIEAMQAGGSLLANIHDRVVNIIRPGIKTKQLNQLAEKLIIKAGGEPSFKQVAGYGFATCININDGVVHGIPGNKMIKNGDLVSVDIGLYYQGFHTDAATTVIAGEGTRKDKKLLQVGKSALKKAIKKAKVGNKVEDISKAIQNTIESSGFSCTRSLTGHGIGKKLHEEPPIPCVVLEESKNSPQLQVGQTLAIEVIYTEGSDSLKLENDGWTLTTEDGKKAGLFEETVLITEKNPYIFTKSKKH
jgi:methionyl aminopeptidase